jgi:hypothetical protein
MANSNLANAKRARNDEFYTQFDDIQKEIEAYLEFDADVFRGKAVYCNCDDPYESNFFRYFVLNFNKLGLKQLITTSYKPSPVANKQLELYGDDQTLTKSKGRPKITANKFIINEVHKIAGEGEFNLKAVAKKLKANKHNEWTPLDGEGDFRSPECVELLKLSDIVVTNPPFSLFREYVEQLFDYNKKFVIIGNKSTVLCKEIFPLIKDNKMWSGKTGWSGGLWFVTMDGDDVDRVVDGVNMKNVPSVWFTNLDHGRRHQPLPLMTMKDNLKYSKHKEIKGKRKYDKYDNFDAIEVPFTDAIPSDYDGVMGVPVSFLDKYNPDQFEIVGITKTWFGTAIKTYPTQIQVNANRKRSEVTKLNDGATLRLDSPPTGQTYYIVGDRNYVQLFPRVLIKHKKTTK